ncbi:MAG: hypothetical protein KatS3mg033_0635 [Thermonema sp.]|jgi:hypothetical protein|uniref:hypothetical protein n=1 Tax=Thermonema TaxID=28194 RepID=UPI00056EB79E|nr:MULTISPECIES: hypothetical protein [Thermonema]GIV38835.1 MAG: hypothetical protein KatS3mg033_0635 [Thermonema sp.]
MQNLRWLFVLILALGLQACNLDQYNNSDPETLTDRRAGDPYVYGDPDGEPRQALLDYPDPADGAARAKKIREKLYAPMNPADFYRQYITIQKNQSSNQAEENQNKEDKQS